MQLFPMYSGSGSGSMDQEPNHYYSAAASSTSVDCTLSLGTPSTRHTNSTAGASALINRSSSNSLFWDISITDQSKAQRCYPTAAAPTFRLPVINPHPAAASSSSNLGGSDPLLLARRCANCDTTSTPLWRNGPRGPKSLCNACGIRYKKEERRSAASAAAAVSLKDATGHHHGRQQQQYPWTSNPASSPWYQNVSEDQHHQQQQSPCLSWRLNVIPTHQFDFDRPSLFQYQ